MTTIRYGAGAILALTFLGMLAIVVHGFWLDPHYNVPDYVAGILATVLGVAYALLGVHVGANGVVVGVGAAHEATVPQAGRG